jgi:hypothetical protein
MLLSALESWSFSVQTPIPDYLHENLSDKSDMLKKQILDNTNPRQPVAGNLPRQ